MASQPIIGRLQGLGRRRVAKEKPKHKPFGQRIVRLTISAYVAALCIVACFSLGGYWLLENTIRENASSSKLINVAGFQRALVNRMALQAQLSVNRHENVSAQFAKNLTLFAKSHRAQTSGSGLGIELPLSEEGRALFFSGPDALDTLVKQYLSKARAFGQTADQVQRQSLANDLATAATGTLFSKLDQAVALYEREADARREVLQKRHIMIVAGALLTLVLEALFIYQPLIRRLRLQLGNLYESATRDCLTGLASRRYFLDMMQREQALGRRNKQDCYLLFIDIDHLKAVNEVFGSAAGDRALVALAKLLKRELRESDVPARIAGEEFGITVRDATLDDMWSLAERIRSAVEKLDVTDVPPMTVSLGITRLGPYEAPDDACARGDQALAQAKSSGRNTVATNL